MPQNGERALETGAEPFGSMLAAEMGLPLPPGSPSLRAGPR
ncbi:hypothetical protein [Nitrosomonas sp. Is37]|nr:hypothetical protein [Nitrosomonas sp. Is37]MDV6344739.1 hypothetical protein [Nitrosomonas sp. Is37]